MKKRFNLLTDVRLVLARTRRRPPAHGRWHVVDWRRLGHDAVCSVETVHVLTRTLDAHGAPVTVRDPEPFAAGLAVDAPAAEATCPRCRSLVRHMNVIDYPIAVAHELALADNAHTDRERAATRTAAVDAAHTQARICAWWHRMTSGRSHDPGVSLLYSWLRVDQAHAADAGQHALAAAIGDRIAALQADYDAWRADQDRSYAAQVAQVAAERAAAARTPIVIVGCGSRKQSVPAPAGELYTGSYHAAARRAAATLGGRLLILSARHGLLTPEEVIAPYEQRMGAPGSITAAHLHTQAAALGILDTTVTVLAGRAYADLATAVWPAAARPLDGNRGMGAQLARLAAIAATPAPPGLGSEGLDAGSRR